MAGELATARSMKFTVDETPAGPPISHDSVAISAPDGTEAAEALRNAVAYGLEGPGAAVREFEGC
jgi:hypothetical protein